MYEYQGMNGLIRNKYACNIERAYVQLIFMFLKNGTLCKGNKIGSAQDLRRITDCSDCNSALYSASIAHIDYLISPYTDSYGFTPAQVHFVFSCFLNIANYSTEGSQLKVVD